MSSTITKLEAFIRRYDKSVEAEPSASYDAEVEYCEDIIADLCAEYLLTYSGSSSIPLPIQQKEERRHLYLWIRAEEEYVTGKFDIDQMAQRIEHDKHMKETHLSLDGWWLRQIVQYYDRARIAFQVADEMHAKAAATMTDSDARSKAHRQARYMEQRGTQALAKAMLTAKGCVESSIRVFGNLPKPGLPSGEIEEWT